MKSPSCPASPQASVEGRGEKRRQEQAHQTQARYDVHFVSNGLVRMRLMVTSAAHHSQD